MTDTTPAKSLRIEELITFAVEWEAAGVGTVQQWEYWEMRGVDVFQLDASVIADQVHGLMNIVVAVCRRTHVHVKRALRAATPQSLAIARIKLGHLPRFSAVLDAEMHFRMGLLAKDWSLIPDGAGRLTVRKVYRKESDKTEH